MSRAADCYDNAFMESCFGTIMTELEMTEYEDVGVGARELVEYFRYYNCDRKHSRTATESTPASATKRQ
ncbi:hypothetical protein Enr8_39910 [Blastopirellula retiformator]|uniref:Integrase catalytic domain-containing protein n=2 Tax=Blastopirellula retiformator TaxID=2527970 RepID=A0A5C5V2Z1_9BACT|nr:hypothetical protein Enr8_39910 [Blastopirellula retiformator]